MKACDTKLGDTLVKTCGLAVPSLAFPGCGTNDLSAVRDCVAAADGAGPGRGGQRSSVPSP